MDQNENGVNGEAMDFYVGTLNIQSPDLVVHDDITVTGSPIAGKPVTISYTVENVGIQTAIGSWVDSIFISADDQWDIGDALFGRVTHTGDISSGLVYSESRTANWPGLLPGTYHVIVRTDNQSDVPESDETNNVGVSAASWTSDVDEITFGVNDSFTLTAAYFKLDAPLGRTLNIRLADGASGASNRLYISYGQVPTRSVYEHAATASGQANPEVEFTSQKDGYYYILVYNSYVPSGETNTCRLEASQPGFAIHSLSVTQGSNLGSITTVIRGAELTPDTTAHLVFDGLRWCTAARTWWVDSTEIWATFDLSNSLGASPLPEGNYDVELDSGGVTVSLPGGFSVVDGGREGDLELDIRVPTGLRWSRYARGTVYYRNTGLTDIEAPLLMLQANVPMTISTSSHTTSSFTDDGGISYTPTAATVEHGLVPLASSPLFLGGSPTGPPGILAPGSSGSFSFGFRFENMGDYVIGVSAVDLDKKIYWDDLSYLPDWREVDPALGFYDTGDKKVYYRANGEISDYEWGNPLPGEQWEDGRRWLYVRKGYQVMKEASQPAYVQDDAWDAFWGNLENLVGPTWGGLTGTNRRKCQPPSPIGSGRLGVQLR